MNISFVQAAKGAEVPISIPRHVTCTECGGNGAAPGTKPETCAKCNGSGQIRHSQGFFQVSAPCAACGGRGQTIPHPCPKCKGQGIVQQQRSLTVRIPAGVYNGARLRLRGEGEAGIHGGPSGDLYVVLRVEEDKTFARQGQNLIYTAKISFPEAALGARIQVPGLPDEDPMDMDIPKGTQSGSVFRLAGKGLPYPGENRTGDMLVEVIVLTPSKLTAEQEELLREFDRLTKEQENTISGKVKKAMGKFGKAMGME
jgi:molecular chaperone DnaJ